MGIFPWLSRTAGENFLDILGKYVYIWAYFGIISVVIQDSWRKFLGFYMKAGGYISRVLQD